MGGHLSSRQYYGALIPHTNNRGSTGRHSVPAAPTARLHGCHRSPRASFFMDELAAAAAVVAMSISDDADEDSELEDAPGAVRHWMEVLGALGAI